MSSSVWRPVRALVFIAFVVPACSQEPTTPTGPTTVTTTPVGPTSVTPPLPGTLQMGMPADFVDIATTGFGLLPYGYHGLSHAIDGHSGWDIELRFGTTVRAAADGQVLAVLPDAVTPGRITLKVETVLNNHYYDLVYGNLSSLTDDVVEGAPVKRGQALGVAGVITSTFGNVSLTESMVHFQVDDFEYYREIPNPNAVGLEVFLTADGKQIFDRLWSIAWYPEELTEPFAANPRSAVFPLVRTWRRESGNGPMGIRFTRQTVQTTDYTYEILAESGTVIETGRVMLHFARPSPTIDFVSPTGTRLGVYDIVEDRLRLSLGSPGASRPPDISDASIYRTAKPPASN